MLPPGQSPWKVRISFSRSVNMASTLDATTDALTQCSMTQATSKALTIIGLIVLVGAGVGAMVAKGAADREASVAQFAASFDNRLIDFDPDYTGMWVLVVIAALGAVALIAGVAGRRGDAEKSPHPEEG